MNKWTILRKVILTRRFILVWNAILRQWLRIFGKWVEKYGNYIFGLLAGAYGLYFYIRIIFGIIYGR